MDERLRAFVDQPPDAAMITLSKDGSAHMARIEVTVVDGRPWSSGARRLVRTRNLRCDPRCSLFVFGENPHWVGLETDVTLLDGPDAPDQPLRLIRARPTGHAPAG